MVPIDFKPKIDFLAFPHAFGSDSYRPPLLHHGLRTCSRRSRSLGARTDPGTPLAEIMVSVLSPAESQRLLGVPLTRRGIQAVFLQVTNRHSSPLRWRRSTSIRHYYTPLEAAGINHFSVLKRLSAFGVAAWYFLPLVMLLPWKLITAARANQRMDDCFRQLAFPLRPVLPGETLPDSSTQHSMRAPRPCMCVCTRPKISPRPRTESRQRKVFTMARWSI